MFIKVIVNLLMKSILAYSVLLWLSVSACLAVEQVSSTNSSPALSSPARLRLMAYYNVGDYDAEPRLPNGRVDVGFLNSRLKELGMRTYFWLVWHNTNDWADLKLFLPMAASSGINVWVYLVPPTESPPNNSSYSEPFRLDYGLWAEEIALLSIQQTNLVGWVIDDFLSNCNVFTPTFIGNCQARARNINPKLVFFRWCIFLRSHEPSWMTIEILSMEWW